MFGSKILKVHRLAPSSFSPTKKNSFVTTAKKDRFSISSSEKTAKTLNISWKDRHQSKFHYIWLRDNCKCHECVAEHSGQKLYNPADIKETVSPKDLALDIVDGTNQLKVEWNDGHKSIYDTNWLRSNCYSDSARRERGRDAVATPWEKTDLEKNIPSLSFKDVMKNEQSLYEWAHNLKKYGLCLIKDTPTENNKVVEVAERIAYVRETMYGKTFDVINVPNAMNIAYTAVHLDYHQDLLYYEAPPGLQFLHCLKHAAKGGDSLFLDGLKAAEIMRSRHPELFQVLTTVPTTYHKQGKDHSMGRQKYIIEVDEFDEVKCINYAPPFGGTISAPPKQVENYYAAIRAFTKITRDRSLGLLFRLHPGDLVTFDNRRLLHARTEFDPNSGERHLQGLYIDYDDFMSKFRVLSSKYESK